MTERKRGLCVLIVLILLGIGGGAFFLLKNAPQKDESTTPTKEEGYFAPLKIHGYSSGNVPYLNIIIEDKTIPAIIDLGFTGTLSLPSHLVKDIASKKWIQCKQSYGVRGKTHQCNVYELENIKIHNMTVFSVNVQEKKPESINEGILLGPPNPEEDHFGTIGYELFEDYNLLIDCRYSFLAICDSVETLKEEGYPVDCFIEVPLISNSNFVAFEALTEYGSLSCMLDTGCTSNILNKDLENGSNDHRILTATSDSLFSLNPENKDLLIYDYEDTQDLSSFKIGGKEFGPLTFHRIKSPVNIDVILGMQFFNSNLVFIDFENKKVYFFPYTGEGEVIIGAGHEKKH